MLNKKNSITTAIILAGFIASGAANSAQGDKISKVINISATIPSENFSVEPVFGSWPTDLELEYNQTDMTFNPRTIRLEAVTATGLRAQLQQDPVLVNGTTEVPLQVTVDGRELEGSPIQIYQNSDTESLATEERIFDLSISAEGTHDVEGLYAGVVNVVFEDNF